MLAVFGVPAALAQAATTTTLALSSSSVATGTVVTFTATVRNPSLVTKGTVTFCNASAPYCEDSAIIGTAQLTSAGTAIIRLVPGIGVHLYEAVFTATTANAGSNSSASPRSLIVTGLFPTATTILASGSSAGSNYTLTGTVVGTGSIAFSPTPTVSFLDTSNGNASLGTATLGGSTFAQTFAPQLTSATLGDSNDVAVGDFNRDGLLDVVVLNYYASSLSVFLGAGDGTFGTPTQFPADFTCYSVVVGDFNGDGKLDLAVTNINAWTVSIYLGNGDGTFQSKRDYPVGGRPQGLVVGDFNRDGNLDLAVANTSSASVSILLGDGLGGFAAQVTYPVGNSPNSVAVADFNGDGFPDLAVTNYSDGTLSVLLGTVTGTFSQQEIYATGTLPNSVAVGDFNGDGKPDLAVANIVSGNVSIFLNAANGTGAFADQVSYSSGGGSTAIVVGDFNGDGFPDLAVANEYSGNVSVLMGTATGTFQAQVVYPTGNNPVGLVVGDFNGDGNPDLAVANGNSILSLLPNLVTQTATALLSGFAIPQLGTSHLIDASYGGNSHFSSSASPTIPTPTATTLQLNAPSTSSSGEPVMLTAQLNPSTNQNLTPTGTVTFYNGVIPLGTETMPASGAATLTVATLPTGSDSLTAAYGGDTNFLPTTSPVVILAVAPATLTLTWAAPVAVASGTALSATQLDASASVPGTLIYTPAVGFVPPIGTTALSVVFHPTDAVDYTASTATVNLVVVSSPTTTLALSSSTVALGTAVTLTATTKTGGLPVTAGTVTFCNSLATHCDNAALIGTAQLTAAGTAIIKLRPGLGPHSYKAVFAATLTSAPSTSSAQTVTVTGVYATSTSISSSGSPGNYTLTGTVSGPGNFTLPPTGTVSFLDTTNGNFLLGQAALANLNSSQSFNLSGALSTNSPDISLR